MLKKITCLVVVMALLCAVPVFAAEPELKTSEAGIQFIKEQEGFSATAYEDSIGWAIGYGTHCDVSLIAIPSAKRRWNSWSSAGSGRR